MGGKGEFIVMAKSIKHSKSFRENKSSNRSSRRITVTTVVLCLLFLVGTVAIVHAETYAFILKWNARSDSSDFIYQEGIVFNR